MTTISVIFDAIPIILAVIGIYQFQFLVLRSRIEYLAVICAILLIICQSSWIISYILEKSIVLTIVDKLWSVFNVIAMILVIYIIQGMKKK